MEGGSWGEWALPCSPSSERVYGYIKGLEKYVAGALGCMYISEWQL